LSTEKATDSTSFSWPTNRRVVLPEAMSHSRSSESHEADRAKAPSDEMTTSDTKCECPRRARRAYPYESSSPVAECVSCHAITDLSRDDESSRFGSSGVVARLVIQSLCPFSVPRRVRFSEAVVIVSSGTSLLNGFSDRSQPSKGTPHNAI
jgi:hypothetical protein